MSTRNKLVIITSLILLGMIITVGSLVYVYFINYSYEDFNERLKSRAVSLAKIELSNHPDTLKNQIKSDFISHFGDEHQYVVRLDTLDLAALGQTAALPYSFLSKTLDNGENYWVNGDISICGIVYKKENTSYLVIVSAINSLSKHHQRFYKRLLLITIGLSLFFIFLISYWITTRFSKPLNDFLKKFNEISTESLHLRIHNSYKTIELDILRDSFNVMLDRIETAFEAHKNFISNASHELRNPLTSIIAEADLALYKTRSEVSYKETLRAILEEADELNDKVQALLFLAQTGYKDTKLLLSPLRIDEILIECKETFNKLNPENNIYLNFSNLPEESAKLKIMGDKALLMLAITNIVGNGLKYSKNEKVEVSFSWKDELIIIIITDKGIGIPESEMPFIYDPYFRASNTENFEGYGIGLPLARNIIRLHKGELRIHSKANEGVKAEIVMPLA